MDEQKTKDLLEWKDPELIDLDKSMASVEAGIGTTTDGFMASSS